MRRIISKLNSKLTVVVLAALLIVCAAPAAQAVTAQGECGENLTWSLDGGTLTITGSGEMTVFSDPEEVPWYAYRSEILRLSLPEGLESVGQLAFYGCDALTAVTLPDSVERVEDYAFMDCTAMVLIDLGNGLRVIGESAFSDCYVLRALNLPGSLQTIGYKAFYRCESIASVVIPESVTAIGTSAFGYCKNLVRADIRAKINVVPEYLFYNCEKLVSVELPDELDGVGKTAFDGCEQLSSVSYEGGSEETRKEIEAAVGAAAGREPDPAPSAGGVIVDDVNATITQETTTVTKEENASVSTTVEQTYPQGPMDDATNHDTNPGADIEVTVNGEDGWEEAKKLLENALAELEKTVDTKKNPVELDLYVTGTDEIDQGFMDALAGMNILATVHTRDGSSWKVDFARMDEDRLSGAYTLSCTVSAASDEVCTELGADDVFVLRFNRSAEVDAEVMVSLGNRYARRNAALFKRDGNEIKRFQTVVSDGAGCVHLYLASVDADTDYYIVMDLAAENNDAILPDELLAEYGEEIVRYQPIQYEITGRTSSWGMNINQVTWIMVGVLAVVIVGVGVTMFLLNKRKLAQGYVPDIYDDEDEE